MSYFAVSVYEREKREKKVMVRDSVYSVYSENSNKMLLVLKKDGEFYLLHSENYRPKIYIYFKDGISIEHMKRIKKFPNARVRKLVTETVPHKMKKLRKEDMIL